MRRVKSLLESKNKMTNIYNTVFFFYFNLLAAAKTLTKSKVDGPQPKKSKEKKKRWSTKHTHAIVKSQRNSSLVLISKSVQEEKVTKVVGILAPQLSHCQSFLSFYYFFFRSPFSTYLSYRLTDTQLQELVSSRTDLGRKKKGRPFLRRLKRKPPLAGNGCRRLLFLFLTTSVSSSWTSIFQH